MGSNPSNKSSIDRRRYPRVMAPVFYRSPRLVSDKRKVTNISPVGVRVYSDKPLQIGEQLEMEFFLPNGNSIESVVRVVWITELPAGSEAMYEVGLKFTYLSPSSTDELNSILESDSDTESE